MTITCNLYINGQWHDAEGRRTFTRRHPAHDEAASVAAAASLADGKRCVEAAACAFPLWRDTAPAERRRLLLEAAEQMLLREAKFIAAMAAETGATAHWAGFNVHLAADILREAAALTTQIEGQIIPSNVPGNLAMGVRQGAGVVNYLTCAPEDAPALVESLIAHPAVRRVNFTGSTPVGRIIARTCGQYLKPAVLELGGKAPLLVLDDADIEQAAAGAVFGAFANAGQICMSTERIIVDNAVAEAFIPLLARRAAALPAALTGPVVDMNTIARCNALIDDALAKGARLLTGGKANDTHMSPTLLDGVTREMRLWREESFGPVKAIIRVHSEEEALAVANDSEYGLSAAVYSRDSARAWNVAQRLHTGICHINGPTVHDEAQMPFGGCKASGYGRFGGRAGIAEFTELRWITIQTQPRELPF
ncbi:4-aminobutyraldehyde dehydrogenase [Klebsiella pneumoniae]|nr:4-aminobutyraldehyde dehydrogenase [Klebsiella pneumoniae]STW36005.1 4-aminobutyraldehyde dehydrogenase [Klebsiella pneumoniae]VTM31494.1 4-aminobutyraldehyde dehydrogenase [Klebsiella pneumoniae]VTM63180.1 4-aminobutyraldehyde dehydrogenase [Klebsiella pneumoniae]